MIRALIRFFKAAKAIDQLQNEVVLLRRDIEHVALAIKTVSSVVNDHNTAITISFEQQEQIMEAMGKRPVISSPFPPVHPQKEGKPN